MSNYELDMFNIKMARADAKSELRKNAKKTCTFCNKVGHVVYQMGILTCPLLKQTSCNACGLLGHTPKFCIFLKKRR